MYTKRGYLIIGLLIIIILISGCVKEINIPSNNQAVDEETNAAIQEEKEVQNANLGSLCSGKEECVNFCLSNRGRCEEYCKGNTNNELCLIVFYSENQNSVNEIKQEYCVSNKQPIFTAQFIDPAHISEISTMSGPRFSNPGGAARTYITMKPEASSAAPVPVYSPVDAVITRITYANRNLGVHGIRPEYRLDFQVSCEVTFVFDHLAALDESLLEFAPKIPADKTNTPVYVHIPVSAGQLVGYTDRNVISGNWDFMVQNTAVERTFINPERWVAQHSLYGDCPYDYFTEKLNQTYYALLTEVLPGQNQCGSPVLEKAGTLAGAWFQGTAIENEGSRLSARGNNHLTDIEILRDGEDRIDIRDTNGGRTKPDNVHIGDSVCYYDNDRQLFAFFSLAAENKLYLANGNGSCPSSFPAEYDVWIR